MSINDNIEFLENMKQGFQQTVSWNKYRSEITIQQNNLDYMIDPSFGNINRLFVVSFKTDTINPFVKYYISLVCINVLL